MKQPAYCEKHQRNNLGNKYGICPECVSEERKWNGEGLPPVGTVCQWNNGNEWVIVTVLGVNGGEVWVKPEDDSESFVVADSDFRPIPDLNERELAIQEITQIIDHNGVDPLNSAKQIYDAGYRKYSAAPGFEYRLVCQCCGSKVEPGQEIYHGCDV